MKEVNDMTDQFDVQLNSLHTHRAPKVEIDAAISVYESVRTARSICQALLPDGFGDASVVAVAVEIGAEVHAAQGADSLE